MEGRLVIAKLLLLSQDPNNQTFVARDEGCMTGLVSSLLNIDPEIVSVAARTLEFLSGHPQNKKVMREFPRLVENLVQASSASVKNLRTREFCNSTLENLGVSLTSDGENDSSRTNGDENSNANDENVESNQGNILKASYQKVTIYVDGLEDGNTCVLVQRILVNVAGVISVSLDKANGAASVGTRDSAVEKLVHRLCDALEKAGISSRKTKARPSKETDIVADDDKEINESTSLAQASYEEEDSGYLDETDYHGESQSAMTRWGPSSLEARLEQERREEELRAAETGRILTRVSSALTNASSWLMGW